MEHHPALSSGNVAVITGAADGIGFSAAEKLLGMGLQVCIADIDGEKLQEASSRLGDVLAAETDVSSIDDTRRLKEAVYSKYGKVNVLMNNAGTGLAGNDSWTEYENWLTTINVNLIGVINGIHSFVPTMLEQAETGLVINTGSKQGITCPPGNPAYNVSKAGVKSVTEALQHSFRNTEGCQLSAHLLVPGFTYSGMLRQFLPEKPDGAWTTEQVVDFMIEHVNQGDFYILCPDNDTTRNMDNKRMEWAMGDLIHNRPALSRWHSDYEEAFKKFMNG
jgi:NADP-dependent 3-hydroxy acid dehydrogenase YdfG